MDIIIRHETKKDWYETEYMTKKAFWNKHVPGADEHFLVHRLRKDKSYIPEISRVAELDGRVVGTIMYSRSYVDTGKGKVSVVTFGPLCVEPEYQGMGIGGKLLLETLKITKEAGYRAVIIFGEPDYYPRFGFVTCDRYGITTKEGKNFPAFMGRELAENGLYGITGRFYEAEIFENLPRGEVDEYDKKFPYMEKLKLPGQWG